MSRLTDDIHEAVARVLQAHGAGLLSRAVLVIEVLGEHDGQLGLYVEASPADMPLWDRAGMIRYADMDLASRITADRLTTGDEVEEEDE
ncbi:hypothetical protein GCM10010193_57230 [Kitasatospora atroaurantiaca]|uniref:Uncharacterized protein n=1 Tax=Kitasatospora atroaurantiaca TaxID=285545 RepID=A0A561EMX4_9ACTN|nr:hypothetical protein [Kitasatospora atroaurantiaca]TWE16971.1 hypothetical protein FB465_1966 [Kitasatospora atroaurantiaca]